MVFPNIKNSEWTLYDYARIVFWIAISTVSISVIGVALGVLGYQIDFLSILVQNPSVDFFGNSLTLILNIFSIVFLIVIFLVQNANQKYSNRLSRVIFHDQYFVGSALFIILASIFNLSGSYFDWQPPLTTIGFAFSISSIIIVASLILLAGYFIDVSNIVEYLTRKYKSEITSDKIYLESPYGARPQDKKYIQDLTTNVQLISSTCIRSIEENNHTLANTCLESLLTITNQYLLETDPDDPNTDFLQNLNDEFQFIGSAAFEENTRQKYSHVVVETVGKIGVNITKRRKLGTPGDIWSGLLKRLFEDAVEFERNKVGPISIRKLGEMSEVAILKGDFDSFGLYLDNLKEIAAICISKDKLYFNNLTQNVSQQLQSFYIAFIRVLCTDGIYSDYDIEQLLDTYSRIFIMAKVKFSYAGRDALFASIENPTQPFTAKLAVALQQYYPLEFNRQEKLAEYLSLLIRFLQNIGEQIETNERALYKVYTEVFYVYAQFTPINEQRKFELLSDLNEKWIQLIDETYRHHISTDENPDYYLEYNISNFYAIAIYFYRHDPETMAKLVESLLQEYKDLKSEYPKRDRIKEQHIEQLYLQLKLIGAWIDEVNDLGAVSPEVKQILVDDFYESNLVGTQIPFSGLEKYNYPVTDHTSKSGWWLRPDPVWSNRFQENISNLLNGGNSKHYETFHEELRARHNLQKAVKTGTILHSIVVDKS